MRHRYFSYLAAMSGPRVQAVDDDFAWWAGTRLVRGPRLSGSEWRTPAKFLCDRGTSVLGDAPACDITNICLASDNFRAFLVLHCPNCFKFWPVEVVDGRDPPRDKSRRYWAIEWVQKYRCLHKNAFIKGDDGKPDPMYPIIDHAKLSDSALMGAVEEWPEYQIIRSDLVKKLKAAGIKGPTFSKLPQVLRKLPPRVSKRKTPPPKSRTHSKRSK